MTAATGFRRLGIALAAIAAVAAGVFLTMTLLISPETVRARVETEIRTVTGLNPVLRGQATVSLFPSGSVSFADVLLGDTQQPALTAERLTARLRFFPLLIGRVEIADVALERPVIAVKMDAGGRSNWSGLVDMLARSQKPNANPISAFSEIRIDRGTVLLHDPARNIMESAHDVQLSLAWPSISKSFGASGQFVWHGETVDASVALSDFAGALAGERSGIKVRLASAPMKTAFDGSFSTRPTLRVEGTLAADAPSLRQALRWSGRKPLPGGGLERFALKAQTSIAGGTIALSNVNVELDGNSAEGVLTFATDGRQTLQGTLAVEKLDLTPYLSTIRIVNASAQTWDRGRIALDGLNGVDFDLRISAANVAISDAKLGRTAIGANLRGGRLTVAVGESLAYGGLIKGSIVLAGVPQGVDVKAQLQFTDVDLENCLGQLAGLRRLEGKGNIAFALEGSGESVFEVMRTLTGTANLTGGQGALVGLNVEQLLRRLERRPLSGGGAFRSGRTPYDRIAINLKIDQGAMTTDDVKIDGASVRVALAGSASIPARELDLKGTASLLASAKDAPPAFELPFIVQGSWDAPIMLPDPQSLIRRSGAAAPLLNREAHSAVRSVIERLTGTQAPTPAPAPPQPAQ